MTDKVKKTKEEYAADFRLKRAVEKILVRKALAAGIRATRDEVKTELERMGKRASLMDIAVE